MEKTTIKGQPEIVDLQENDWIRVKDLRLNALKQDPQAFGSNLQKELGYPDDLWIERHKDALEGKTWLVCAQINKQMVGMMKAFKKTEDTANIIGVFVEKNARGKGVAKLMMTDLLEKIKADPKMKRVSLTVNVNQESALKLYQSYGFEITGEEESQMGDGNVYKEWEMKLALKK